MEGRFSVKSRLIALYEVLSVTTKAQRRAQKRFAKMAKARARKLRAKKIKRLTAELRRLRRRK